MTKKQNTDTDALTKKEKSRWGQVREDTPRSRRSIASRLAGSGGQGFSLPDGSNSLQVTRDVPVGTQSGWKWREQ
jgi:hypothetical protein